MNNNPKIKYKKGQQMQEDQENEKVFAVMLLGFVKAKDIEVETSTLDNDKVQDDPTKELGGTLF